MFIKIKIMKSIKIILITLLFYNFISISNNSNKIIRKPINITTIDSLQGYWQLQIKPNISCNIYQSNFQYMDSFGSFYNITSSKIYFSDTIVNRRHEYLFNQIQIDTTKKTGSYLILVYPSDSTVDCYKFGGFNYDLIDTTFSITDVWDKHRTLNFKKVARTTRFPLINVDSI